MRLATLGEEGGEFHGKKMTAVEAMLGSKEIKEFKKPFAPKNMWKLEILACDPSETSKGVGTALMRAVANSVDAEGGGTPFYVE